MAETETNYFTSDNTYEWNPHTEGKINATEVGSPCLRYVLRPPDGHKDVDLRDQGLYSFSAFGLRKDIGGDITQRRRSQSVFGSRDMIAYSADFDQPLNADFLGVTTPGVFNFEVLDEFQQKPSLVGAAHLHMHAPDFNGAVIVGFNGDGSIMYVEAKQGTRREHDSVLVYRDKVVTKLGAHLTGIRRDEEYIFGVPRWSFSEDISAKFIAENTPDSEEFRTDPYDFEMEISPDLEVGKMRLGHPKNPTGFANRHQAYLVTTFFPESPKPSLSVPIQNIMESAPLGPVTTELTVDSESLAVRAQNEKRVVVQYRGSNRLVEQLSEGLEVLPYNQLEKLNLDLVSDYAEYIYLKLHPLLGVRNDGSINLSV